MISLNYLFFDSSRAPVISAYCQVEQFITSLNIGKMFVVEEIKIRGAKIDVINRVVKVGWCNNSILLYRKAGMPLPRGVLSFFLTLAIHVSAGLLSHSITFLSPEHFFAMFL